MLSRKIMVESMTNLLFQLPNLNLLFKELLPEDIWEALLQDKFNELEEKCNKEYNFLLSSILFYFIFYSCLFHQHCLQ